RVPGSASARRRRDARNRCRNRDPAVPPTAVRAAGCSWEAVAWKEAQQPFRSEGKVRRETQWVACSWSPVRGAYRTIPDEWDSTGNAAREREDRNRGVRSSACAAQPCRIRRCRRRAGGLLEKMRQVDHEGLTDGFGSGRQNRGCRSGIEPEGLGKNHVLLPIRRKPDDRLAPDKTTEDVRSATGHFGKQFRQFWLGSE